MRQRIGTFFINLRLLVTLISVYVVVMYIFGIGHWFE
jgi:hypothetical protein